MRYRRETQRPDDWTLAPGHWMRGGMRFFAGGHGHGSARMIDSSGFGNHGVLTNMTPLTDWVYAPELGRMATDYDGSNDHIVLPAGSAILTAAPITLAAWFKPTVATVDEAIVGLGQTGASGADYFALGSYGALTGDPVRAVADGTTPAYASSASGFAAGVWQHGIAEFKNDASRTAYLNGVPGTANTTNMAPASVTLGTIGGLRRTALAIPFTGSICDVLIFNRVLSRSEIAALADPQWSIMCGGLIVPRRRIMWPVWAGATYTATAAHPTIKRFGGVPFAAGSGKGVW